ncbi:MAG TPA: hypothetical protein HA367_06530 [Candidatus Methanofastidiosum sp.]|nr:hypothetical protein [Methanofastidiosum sp.]
MDDLIFEPLVRFMSKGNEIQRCTTMYKNIGICWETFFPHNIFKDPIDRFTVDLVLPIGTTLHESGYMNPNYYTDEGFGMPEFKTLDNAIEFIDSYCNLLITP